MRFCEREACVLNHLGQFLDVMKADAALIHRPENMRWLSGYTGEGCLFIGRGIKAIVTDFRYVEQAKRQSPGWEVLMVSGDRRYGAIGAELAANCGAKTVYVETDVLTYDAYTMWAKALEGRELVSLAGAVEELRAVKDPEEIANIRAACALASRAFENMLPKLHAGMTEKQARRVLEDEMLDLGSEGTAFETIAAAGVNGALPHARPSDHVIEKGELITFDFGATVNGYLSDMTRTVGIGKIGPELRDIYETVRVAQQMVLDEIGPGKVTGDLDRLAREFIDSHPRYKDTFGHSLGHGVGLFIHELPRVSSKDTTVLKPGHVVTDEPGIYIPGVGGVRIEDTVIITEDGYIDPVTAPKHLIEL